MEKEIEQELAELVTFIDPETNEEIDFLHVLTFAYEGKKYAALVPSEQADLDEAEVMFVELTKDAEGDAYIPVESEVLLEELFDEFNALLDEMYEEEADSD